MTRILGILILLLLPLAAAAGPVKLSHSGICHDAGSPWYDRTQDFQAMPDMASCLREGRAYRGYVAPGGGIPYDRALYGDWAPSDHACRDTRQDVLASLSTVPVTWNAQGCRVLRGRWIDPYTDSVVLDASRLDIDHVVPLAYAHAHGAAAWPEEKRHAFANDPRNLLAVDAGANRSKGMQGPADWLPPEEGFRCQYLLRFQRVMKLYGLKTGPEETRTLAGLRDAHCGAGSS